MTRCKVEDEVDRLLKLEIIEPVNRLTSWLNPFVPIPKLDAAIRLCLDMRQANKAVVRATRNTINRGHSSRTQWCMCIHQSQSKGKIPPDSVT